MKTATLFNAYEWICDECGRNNFVSSIIYEFDEETEKEMKEDHGIEVWETGQWSTIPDEVICKYCNTKYSTKHQYEDT